MEPGVIYATDPDLELEITYRPETWLVSTFASSLDDLWKCFKVYYESREDSEKDSTQGVTGMKAAVANMKETWKEQIKTKIEGSDMKRGLSGSKRHTKSLNHQSAPPTMNEWICNFTLHTALTWPAPIKAWTRTGPWKRARSIAWIG